MGPQWITEDVVNRTFVKTLNKVFAGLRRKLRRKRKAEQTDASSESEQDKGAEESDSSAA